MQRRHHVAFLGLGVMGYPMAGHLANAGHTVTVYNRTLTKATQWVKEFGGAYAESPSDACKDSEVVFLCVGNDADVREVTLGEKGVLRSMKPGTVLVDHTTTSATLAREVHSAASAQSVSFLDAPVSGGQSGAVHGALTVMIGGSETACEQVFPLLTAYAKKAVRVGPVGHGQLAKMVNQICIAGVVQGLSEALRFGTNAGLDMPKVVETISKGAAQSWQMEHRADTMLREEFDFGFAVDWMRKDLSFALQEAQRNGSALPLTSFVDEQYAKLQAQGHNRWDTSSLIALLPKQPQQNGQKE